MQPEAIIPFDALRIVSRKGGGISRSSVSPRLSCDGTPSASVWPGGGSSTVKVDTMPAMPSSSRQN